MTDTETGGNSRDSGTGSRGGGPGSERGSGTTGTGGYTVAYARDEAPFLVYLTSGVATVLICAAAWRGDVALFLVALAPTAFAFYNLPLAEVGRPRIGASQYGVFIDGFGIVQWRAIEDIKMIEIAIRSWTTHELQIRLKPQPLARALIADWRRQPLLRRMMRVPWRMTHDNTIRIALDAFEQEPGDVERTFLRMFRYYRG